jgi:hypothetical protein
LLLLLLLVLGSGCAETFCDHVADFVVVQIILCPEKIKTFKKWHFLSQPNTLTMQINLQVTVLQCIKP